MQKEVIQITGVPKQSVSYAAQKLCEKNYSPLVKAEEDVFEQIGFEQINKMLEIAKLFMESFGNVIKE